MSFDWTQLGKYKSVGKFLEGYPPNIRRFYAPDDQIHEVLVAIVKSATISIACAMYGWDDDELDQLFRDAWQKENLPVLLCLDKSQSAGVHEKDLLAKWPQDQIGNRIVIGESRLHAISHLKMVVIDGIYTVQGSTNWSLSGEQKQNNELTLVQDAVFASETRAKIDMVHDEMVKQQPASGSPTTAPGP